MNRTFRPHTLSTLLAGIALSLGASTVSAATWTKTSVAAGSTCNTVSTAGCVIAAPSATDSKTTATAWGNTGSNGAWTAAQLTNQGASGFGVKNGATATDDKDEGGSPEHALDNDQRTDAVLFSFDKTVALTTLATGWAATDQDITVLRYTGSGAPTMGNFSLTNAATPTSNMLGNGWALMGNYAYGAGAATVNLMNTGNWASSHWLVMAYSTAFGSSIKGSSTTAQTLTGGNDYFKLLSVSGVNSNKVAEPGMLALAGLGLFGVAWSRRAKKQAA